MAIYSTDYSSPSSPLSLSHHHHIATYYFPNMCVIAQPSIPKLRSNLIENSRTNVETGSFPEQTDERNFPFNHQRKLTFTFCSQCGPPLICYYERHIKVSEQIPVQCFSRLGPLPSVSSLPFNELGVEHTGNQQEGRLRSAFQVPISSILFFQKVSRPCHKFSPN